MTLNNNNTEIKEQERIVQKQIDEICEYEKDDEIRRKELLNIISGYSRFLKDKGLNGESVMYYIRKLDLSAKFKVVI